MIDKVVHSGHQYEEAYRHPSNSNIHLLLTGNRYYISIMATQLDRR